MNMFNNPSRRNVWTGFGSPAPAYSDAAVRLVLDARGYPPEGNGSLARAIVTFKERGFRRFIIANTRGQRFIGCGLGPRSDGVQIEIYGSPGDYLAESCMAGDPHSGGGFVIVNCVRFDEDGALRELDTPYAGGNLFSLASGGAIYVRDPLQQVGLDQLNGGECAALTAQDWTLIRPYLEKNESIFGIAVEGLLTMHGRRRPPELVYRKILPAGHTALLPEEAWVRREACCVSHRQHSM
jgi:hypothetical protein